MRRRILAVSLAVCMIVQCAVPASASEVFFEEVPSVTSETEAEGQEGALAGADDAADMKTAFFEDSAAEDEAEEILEEGSQDIPDKSAQTEVPGTFWTDDDAAGQTELPEDDTAAAGQTELLKDDTAAAGQAELPEDDTAAAGQAELPEDDTAAADQAEQPEDGIAAGGLVIEGIEEIEGDPIIEEDLAEDSSAAEPVADRAAGSCGTSLSWSLSASGTLTISGSGPMSEYDYVGENADEGSGTSGSDFPWEAYREDITSVVVEDGVTSLAPGAFWGCYELTNVTIGSDVASIGYECFYDCSLLEKVTLGEKLQTIGDSAFDECVSLTSIVLPDQLTAIGAYAFDNCMELAEVTVGASVRTIGESAFVNCSGLTKIVLPGTLESVGSYAFDGCDALAEVHFRGSLPSYMGEDMFATGREEGLKAYYPADDPTWSQLAPQQPLYGAESIEWLPEDGIVWDLANGVLTISAWAKTVEEFQSAADSPWYDRSEEVEKIVIGEIEKIGAYAFEGCRNVRCVWFTGTEPEISHYAFQGVTAVAYCEAENDWSAKAYTNYCGDLDWIRWRITDHQQLIIDGEGDMQESYEEHPEDLPWYSKRSSVVSVDIGNRVASIGAGAFQEWEGLEEVLMRGSIAKIGERAFARDKNLAKVNMENAGIEEVSTEAFSSCGSLKEILWPENLKKIGVKAFFQCSSLEELKLPDSVDEIMESAFKGCGSLVSLNFSVSGKLAVLGEEAFAECASLNKIIIPDSVTTLEDRVFANCNDLERVIVHENVTSFGEGIFAECPSLYVSGYDNTPIQEYLTQEEPQILYVPLNTADRTVAGFSAARDGWCIENNPRMLGKDTEDWYTFSEYFEAYGVTPISVTIGGAEKLAEKLFNHGGYCFGFSLLAAANYLNQIDLSKYFNSSSFNGLNGYGYSQIEKLESGSEIFTLTDNSQVVDLLEYAHILQSSSEMSDARIFKKDKDYSELIEYLRNPNDTDPIIVDMLGYHAVVIDGSLKQSALIDEANGVIAVPIYDPNHPYISEHIDIPADSYTNKRTFMVFFTESGKWTYRTDEKINRSGEFKDLKFYNPSLLPKDFFIAKHSFWVGGRVLLWIEKTRDLLNFHVTNKNHKNLLDIVNGKITFMDDDVEDYSGEVNDPNMMAVMLHGEDFLCSTDGIKITMMGESHYLSADINGTATMNVNIANGICDISTEGNVMTSVAIQKNNSSSSYTAVSLNGTVTDNHVEFSIGNDGKLSVNADDPSQKVDVIVDNGQSSMTYSGLTFSEADGLDTTQVHEHNFVFSVEEEASCTTAGSGHNECSVCGMKQETQTIPALGHNFSAWETVSGSAGQLTEVQESSCTRCGIRRGRSMTVNVMSFPLKTKQSTKKLKVSGLAEGDYIESWQSSNTKIVTVSQSGKIKAKKKTGKAVITITLASGLSKNITVTVKKSKVTTKKIKGIPKKKTLRKGDTFKLSPQLQPITTTQKVTYSSSNKKVATVDKKGKVKAKKKGKVTITVKSGKKKVKCKVTVK